MMDENIDHSHTIAAKQNPQKQTNKQTKNLQQLLTVSIYDMQGNLIIEGSPPRKEVSMHFNEGKSDHHTNSPSGVDLSPRCNY